MTKHVLKLFAGFLTVLLVVLVVLMPPGTEVLGVLLVAALAVGLPIYALPSMIALKRKHPLTPAIAVLNVFLGWTYLGWVAAMVWAFIAPRRT